MSEDFIKIVMLLLAALSIEGLNYKDFEKHESLTNACQ